MNMFLKTTLALSVCAAISTSAMAKEVLVVWEDNGKSFAIDQAAMAFEKENDCKVIVKEVDAVKQIEEYSTTTEKPDVFIVVSDKVGDAASNGIIESLDYMSNEKDLYAEAAINAFSLSGKIWAEPRSVESLVVYYNKDLIEYPFEQFDDYVAYAKKVEKDGKYGLIGKLDNFYFAYGILAGAGGYTFGINADGSFNENDVGLNNEGTVKGLEIIKDYANNHLPKVLLTDEGWGEIDKLFIEGKAAAVISGPWSLDKYAQSGINYGIAPLPQLSNGNFIRPFYGAKGYVVAKASKNKQLAEKFIRTLNKPVYAMMRYVAIAELPPTKEVMTNPLIVNDDFANAIAHQIEHADLMPSIPRMGKVWGAMAECLSDVISGKKDAKTASNEAVEKIQAD